MKDTPYVEIDILKLAKALFKRLWLIIIAAVVFGAGAFSYAAFCIEPTYSADTLLYVNNSSFTIGSSSVSISSGELSAAQSLVETYIAILNTRLTLKEVASESGLNYTYTQIRKMITATAVEDTEIFRVRVTCNSREDSAIIANTIAKVLPQKIAEVVDGSSVRIVDYAVKPKYKTGPDVAKYTAIGIAFGILVSCAGIIIWELTDTIIHDEEYLTKSFPNVPILAVIPNLNGGGTSSRYGYYYTSKKKKNDEEKTNEKGE